MVGNRLARPVAGCTNPGTVCWRALPRPCAAAMLVLALQADQRSSPRLPSSGWSTWAWAWSARPMPPSSNRRIPGQYRSAMLSIDSLLGYVGGFVASVLRAWWPNGPASAWPGASGAACSCCRPCSTCVDAREQAESASLVPLEVAPWQR
ncbi:MAG: hypothetical protein R2851_20430 [Caldilineaceae bacterium]